MRTLCPQLTAMLAENLVVSRIVQHGKVKLTMNHAPTRIHISINLFSNSSESMAMNHVLGAGRQKIPAQYWWSATVIFHVAWNRSGQIHLQSCMLEIGNANVVFCHRMQFWTYYVDSLVKFLLQFPPDEDHSRLWLAVSSWQTIGGWIEIGNLEMEIGSVEPTFSLWLSSSYHKSPDYVSPFALRYTGNYALHVT